MDSNIDKGPAKHYFGWDDSGEKSRLGTKTAKMENPILEGSTAASEPLPLSNWWQRCARFLIRRRVTITVAVFLTLILEDVLIGVRPHDPANFYDGMSMFGLAFVFLGLVLRSWAAGTLVKNAKLTTDGPFLLIRHPLYIGSFMMMVGFCELIDDPENIWFVLGPFMALYLLTILKEERKLRQRFSGQWEAYAHCTPRFIPRRLPRGILTNWNLNQWVKNREYRAFGASLLGLAAIDVWTRLWS